MLKKIPGIISPELMKYMMDMGHSDCIVITDANFPAAAHAKRLVRIDSGQTTELLAAVMQFFPLDDFVDEPVRLMQNRPSEPVPGVWEAYRDIIKSHDEEKAFKEFAMMDRMAFYKETEKAYVVVQTGDTRRYANIILQKGVC